MCLISKWTAVVKFRGGQKNAIMSFQKTMHTLLSELWERKNRFYNYFTNIIDDMKGVLSIWRYIPGVFILNNNIIWLILLQCKVIVIVKNRIMSMMIVNSITNVNVIGLLEVKKVKIKKKWFTTWNYSLSATF